MRLVVGAFDHTLSPATQDEADAWFEAHRPPVVEVPELDLTVTDLVDVDDLGMGDAGFAGGKAAGYGELRKIGPDATVRDGFVIPVYEYRRFLVDSGLEADILGMLAEPGFQADGEVRRARLLALQEAIRATPVGADLLERVGARLADAFPGVRMRFRPSTSIAALDGCCGTAGLYTSASAVPGDPLATVEMAIREVWAGFWSPGAFEQRSWASIPHLGVGMAVLVHPAFSGELAGGVAITANVFDPAPGGEDAFFVNAQAGGSGVTRPEPGVPADELVYYYFHNGQPATYYERSGQAPAGTTLLTRYEQFQLGGALDAIRRHFRTLCDPPPGYGALGLEVEWKLVADDDGEGTHIEIKQARPYPGRGE